MSRSRSPKRGKHSKLRELESPLIPGCPVTHKHSYRSRKRALTALNYSKSHGAPVNSVYKCPHCGDWHLTKQEARP